MRNATFFGFFAVALGAALGSSACGSTSQNLGNNEEADLDHAKGPDGGANGNVPGDENGGKNGDAGNAASGDAGGLGTPVACGSTFCRAGAKCVASECVYECVGTHVPGDYETVENALTVLGKTGGTLCLGPQALTGGSLNAEKPVTIIGSPGTVLDGLSIEGKADVDVRRVKVAGETKVSGDKTAPGSTANVTFTNCELVGGGAGNALLIATGYAADETSTLRVTAVASSFTGASGVSGCTGIHVYRLGMSSVVVDVDAADMHMFEGTGVRISDLSGATSPLRVAVRNSYIHDSDAGIGFDDGHWENALTRSSTFQLTNNTFARNIGAIALWPYHAGTSIEYFNNLLVENEIGVAISMDEGGAAKATVSHGNNLLFGNKNNYSDAAIDGPGYVKANPQLDTATSPPSLKSGSPAKSVGDAAHAPNHDYWGNPRTGGIDLGAIQN